MFSFRAMSRIKHLKFLLGMFLFVNISDRYFVSWTKDEIIREAITERKLLVVDYDGYSRIVEPHLYGRKNQRNGIMAYQIGGHSSDGELGWKRLYMNKISNMSILDEKFLGMRETVNHSAWDLIYLIVDRKETNFSEA